MTIEVLVKPEQEPVAWMRDDSVSADTIWGKYGPKKVFDSDMPLYTTPPQRTWVGLTNEDEIDWEDGGNLKDLVKAIEAKLKEKNT
jgi:hypothetical protein